MAMQGAEFEILCELPEEIDKEFLFANLPPRKTKILEAKSINHIIHLKLFTPYTTMEEVKLWINEFEEVSQTSYSVTTTKDVTGRYVIFKQFLHCRHKTRSTNLYDSSKDKNPTRNTDCPSRIKVTLHAKKKRYRSKDPVRNELFKEMRCEIDIILTHNHSVALSFRKVSNEVKEKLIQLYQRGHSPTTALQTIKMEIRINYKNYEEILMDRMHCPDYKYCYYLYVNQIKEKYRGFDFETSGKDLLQKRIVDYNTEMQENCAQLFLQGSDYIVCLCPPLLKRVHRHCQSSSEIVLVESCNHEANKIFVLLTHSEAGGLPLGVFITSQETPNLQICFQFLKDMLGNAIFSGHPEGPQIFITSESQDEQTAIAAAWPKSKHLLGTFHVLQTIMRWLMEPKHHIPKEHQGIYFNNFKMVLNSETVEECVFIYETSKSTIVHGNYLRYFEDYWERRELWALCYRNTIVSVENHNLFETATTLLKEEILNHVKTFNIVQLVDFILTKFVNYYERQLLDADKNHEHESSRMGFRKPLPSNLLERICIFGDDNIIVPSESTKDLMYIVNLDALTCSCVVGIAGKICKHIHWAATVKQSTRYELYKEDEYAQNMFYYIATGRNPSDSDNQASLHTVENIKTEVAEITIEERSKLITEEFCNVCAGFLEKSPHDVGAALEKMLENMKKIETVSDFVSACSNFASGDKRRSIFLINRRKRVLSRANKLADTIIVKKKIRRIKSE